VWVRGSATHGDPTGIYTGDPATPHEYKVTVATGAAGAPIIFRNYQQDYVIIQDDRAATGLARASMLNVQSPYLIFWGFEVRNVNTGSNRTSERPNLVYNNAGGHDNAYVNLIVHDGGVAILH
jgi:hypothetical protein